MFLELLKELKKNILSALGILLVIMGVIILICLYTPQRTYERNITGAEKAYLKGDFSKAIAKYTKAATNKNNYPESYLGLISAMEASDSEKEELQSVFMEGATLISEMKEEDREKFKDTIVEYFLHESVVFAGDNDTRIEALTIGYDASLGAEDIKRILTECVSEKIADLEKKSKFDEALSLVSDYSDKTDLDSEKLTETLTEEKKFSLEKESLLTRVYNSLKVQYDSCKNDKETDYFSLDFSGIFSLDGSEEAESIAASFLSDSYIMIISGDKDSLTGMGAGLYTFGSKYRTQKGGVAIPYYFYVGEYSEGVRCGFGIAFTTTGEESFISYAGEWKNDLPEGEGKRYEKNTTGETSGYTRTYSGKWSENMAEGEISIVVTESSWEGVIFTGTAKAEKGVCEAQPTESEDYVVLNIRDGNLISVLQSDTEGYALMLTLWKGEGELLTALDIN